MSRTPRKLSGSQAYREAWRAVNLLIRSDGSWSGRERDVCYRNLGGGKFADVSYVAGLDSAGDGRGFVALDIDGDGALDIVEASRTAPRIRVLRNLSRASALILELRGKTQPDSIGATAELFTSSGRRLLRHVEAGSGYLTQGSRRLHFALLPGESPERLEVHWPGGRRQTMSNVPDGGAYRLVEDELAFQAVVPSPAPRREKQPEEKQVSVWLTAPVPSPSLAGLGGAGRKTLVNFWASWCPPCREELTEWASAAAVKRFASAGLRVVIAASSEEGGQRPNAPFAVVSPAPAELAAWNMFHRYLFDHRRDIALPSSFLLDERGRVIKVYHGITPSAVIAADAAMPVAARNAFPFPGRWLGERPKRNYVELATALAEGGLSSESARYFELALAQGDASRETLANYAAALLETGALAKAEALLGKAMAGGGGSDSSAMANLGLLRLRQGRHQEARAVLEKVLAATPDDAMALNALGSALFTAQDLAGAKARFAEAVRLESDNAGYRYNWASALAASGEFPSALREFEWVRERQGDSAALSNNLGILQAEVGAPEKAEAEFRRAIALAPKDPAGYLNLAALLQRTANTATARRVLSDLLKISPTNPRALQMLESLR